MLDDMMLGGNYELDKNEKDGNVFLGLINNIMKSNGSVINKILDNCLKFNSKKMELEEINNILVQVTRSCTLKLYPEECGGYSLRSALNNAEFSPSIHNIALSNITYAVMTAISPVVLGSLFFYFSKDFIFFHIRDGIVEPNYRTYIKEARELYEKPNIHETNIHNMNKFKDMVLTISETMLVDASKRAIDSIESDLAELRNILPSIEPDQAKYVIDNDVKYPLPSFMVDVLCNAITEKTNSSTTNFLNKLSTTFTMNGLRLLFKEFGGIKVIGEQFENKLQKLHTDRLFTNGLIKPIDGITLDQNIILNKMITFSMLSESDESNIKENTILKRINDCLSLYPVIGTDVVIDNDKLVIKNNGNEKVYHYQSSKLDDDLNSPFVVFGSSRSNLENIHNNEPNKFCANQAILSKKDRSNAILDGRHEPSTVKEKTLYNARRMQQLLKNRNVSRDTKVLDEVSKLRRGEFSKLKHVNPNWFSNMVIDDPVRAILVLAEIEGLKNQIVNKTGISSIIPEVKSKS